MGKTLDLGQRIELQAMDKHCQNISIGLYRRDNDGVPQFLVHTYSSSVAEAAQRTMFIKQALIQVIGLEPAPGSNDWLQFPCKDIHERAIKRAFLDLCKLESGITLKPKPLTAFDKKAGCKLSAIHLGDGVYQIVPELGGNVGPKRATAVARGFSKVCEMDPIEGQTDRIQFPCQLPHDGLIGMLLFRAQNVRAAMQEDEIASSRGVLSAPKK